MKGSILPVSLLCLLLARGGVVWAAVELGTDDGLSLSLGKEGQVSAIRLDGREVGLVASPAMFQVRDSAAGSVFVPVGLAVEGGAGELRLVSRDHPLALDLSARISKQGGFLQIDGEVADRTARERCIDLKVCLPIEASGFVRGTGLAEGSAPIRQKKGGKQKGKKAQAVDAEIDRSEPEDNALYPLCPMSNARTGVGLSVAVPPTHPTRFVTGSDGSGAYILIRIGLSQATAKPGRTPFRVIVYRHDPNWGFRSALARYYEFYQADYFQRRVRKIGAWTTQNASALKNPQLYAYHEAGFATWRHPNGTGAGINVRLTLEHLDEGPACSSLEQYEQLCELALDKKYGIYSLPYTIVGQRQLLQLPGLPHNYDESMKVLDTWSVAQPILFDGPPQAVSFRSAEELRTIIRNSTIHDAHHRLQWVARPYRGPTLTFPQNPNPNLYHDTTNDTIAKYTLDYYLPMMFKSRFVDGCYVDSLGRWCSLYNYRREHFKYTTVPLTYSGEPPQPCLWNLASHAEYLQTCAARLHAQDKILFANGVHPNRVMLGFACDAMGEEGAPTYEGGEGFCALRVAAGSKPYCLLNASHRVAARLWNSCLYMGYLMGCNAAQGLADEARYLPMIIKLNEAGWQPVTCARATPAAVGIERWGGHEATAPLFFTVMNRSAEAAAAEVTVDLAALHRPANVHATTLPEVIPVQAGREGDQIVLHLKLAPDQATAIQLNAN